jgi:hypothetical protein
VKNGLLDAREYVGHRQWLGGAVARGGKDGRLGWCSRSAIAPTGSRRRMLSSTALAFLLAAGAVASISEK